MQLGKSSETLIGLCSETIMLTNICNAIAVGLMQPWIPETPKEALVPSPPPANKSPRGSPSRRAQMLSKPSKAVIPVTVNPDATPDLKKGLEVGFVKCFHFRGCTIPIQIFIGKLPAG